MDSPQPEKCLSERAATVLVVEDDHDIATVMTTYLDKAGYQTALATSGTEALAYLADHSTQLIILDWMLPQLDGLDLLSHLRADSDVPVIMVTAKREEENRILGLELGADDYLTKPFSPRELVARVKAVLRRSQISQQTPPLVRGRLTIDPLSRQLQIGKVTVDLTSLEFDLLYTLAREPGRVFARDDLLTRLWGSDYTGVDRVVDVHVYNLRKRISQVDTSCASMIKTVWRIGYKFLEDI